MKIISIHQPNYLPWIGFFNKIAKSDIFVIFDDVQFPRGKTFLNRNKIRIDQGPLWLTVPIKNKSSLLKINEIRINNNIEWNIKHWETIRVNYAKSAFFSNYKKELKEILLKDWVKLCDLNVELIKWVMDILEINTKLIFSSKMTTKCKGIEKILDILKSLNADIYLTGQGKGSQRYIDQETFEKNNIKLLFQNFQHPIYRQRFPGFEPNMSVIDLIFNMGEKSKELI